MKKSIILCSIIVAFLFGCKSQQKATGYSNDDVYTKKSEREKAASKPKIQNEDLTASHKIASSDSITKRPSAAASSNVDYSNNTYATKIKKSNANNQGLNNSGYNGSSDSVSSGGDSSPDVSLYFGNSWGSPFWGPSFSFGMGYGWGDFGFGYPYSWYSPYYWGYPYYGYYPYYSWYWDYPYWGGGHFGHNHWDWYGNNGHYNGIRNPLTSPSGIRNARTNVRNDNPASGQIKNARTVNPAYVNRSTDQTRPNTRQVPPDKQHYSYVRSNVQGNTRVIKNNQGSNVRSDRSNVQRQSPTPKYTRPGNQQQANRTNAQAYTSPAYRQPKSSQEYINPRTQQGRPTGVSQNSTRTGNNINPTSSGRRYSTPYNTGNNARIYSNPSGGSRSYSTPSRSYSSPSRSYGGSYSAPSRSSSSPSHSGGSSGGSSGGGHGRR
jgi:hypothetical protein